MDSSEYRPWVLSGSVRYVPFPTGVYMKAGRTGTAVRGEEKEDWKSEAKFITFHCVPVVHM